MVNGGCLAGQEEPRGTVHLDVGCTGATTDGKVLEEASKGGLFSCVLVFCSAPKSSETAPKLLKLLSGELFYRPK